MNGNNLAEKASGLINEKWLDVTYIDSRVVEKRVLTRLCDLYTSLIEDESVGRGDGCQPQERLLEEDLQGRFNEWQFFNDGSLGFNSGTTGEFFARLLGSGVMNDMPQIETLPQDHDDNGLHVIKKPVSSTDVGKIEIVTSVGIKNTPHSGCKFTFETSLERINQRLVVIDQEMDAKRKEILVIQP